MTASATSPRPRRILHLVFSRRLAGAERYAVDLANRQAQEGNEVHVLGRPGAVVEKCLHPSVRFHTLRLPSLFRGTQVRLLASRLGIDVAHAHLSPACKALARAGDNLAKVATLHVGYKPHQHDRLDGLICVNEAQTAQLGRYAGQARVISNWLPQASAVPAADSASLRSNLGIGHESFVVGAVGRLHASKGMDLLIRAFRATAPAAAALVILGEGAQRDELEKLRDGDQRIHLAGFHDDVQSVLPEFDLFVSPSREETFGLAILEAMSAGLPVLASAAEGPREILRGQPVQLVEPGSLNELSSGLATAFAQRPAGAPSVDRTRVAYELSAFDPAASLARVSAFYDELQARSRSARSAAPLTALAA